MLHAKYLTINSVADVAGALHNKALLHKKAAFCTKSPVLVEREAHMPKIARTGNIIQIECETVAETIKVYASLVARWVETSSTLALNSRAQAASLQHLGYLVKLEEEHRSILKHIEERFPDCKG
jgi:hypothetical protein